jgi:CBS domain-containing protein
MVEHRTVDELMTRNVVRVHPDTPFKGVVRELTENDVTAVPVVDGDGRCGSTCATMPPSAPRSNATCWSGPWGWRRGR